MTEHVKACPFGCKSRMSVRISDGSAPYHVVTCHGCDTEGPLGKTEAEAVRLWNTRPEPSLNGDEELVRLDRACAIAAGQAVNELVAVLIAEGKDAALDRAELIRAKLNRQRDNARAAIAALSTPHGDGLREALEGVRKLIAPLRTQGEDRIWRPVTAAVATIDAALAGQQAHG